MCAAGPFLKPPPPPPSPPPQLDFLPFTCRACKRVYCLEHRSSHGCDLHGDNSSVVICPLCAKAVIVGEGQDPDLVFDRCADDVIRWLALLLTRLQCSVMLPMACMLSSRPC